MILTLTKDILKKDCKWLKRDFKKGEVLNLHKGETYNCIGKNGIACSSEGQLLFFEIPTTALAIEHDKIKYGIFMTEQKGSKNLLYCKEFPIDYMGLLTKIQSNVHLLANNKEMKKPDYKRENRILKVSITRKQVVCEISQLEDIEPSF